MKQLAMAVLFLGLLASALAGCMAGNGAATVAPPAHASQAVRGASPAVGPHASSVIVVIMENRDYDLVIGNAQAPYINNTLVPEAALMTNSHAITHPSQPEIISHCSRVRPQGIVDDSCPHTVFNAESRGRASSPRARVSMDHSGVVMPARRIQGLQHGHAVRAQAQPLGELHRRSERLESGLERHPEAARLPLRSSFRTSATTCTTAAP